MPARPHHFRGCKEETVARFWEEATKKFPDDRAARLDFVAEAVWGRGSKPLGWVLLEKEYRAARRRRKTGRG